jgi:DNA-binding transcriptional LysR family regulator
MRACPVVNLRFVEAFYWVVSLKSVSRAAEKLFITQSAMSSRIAALEEELGVLLLDRRERQFRLTVAGARFFTYAQRLLDLQREVKAELGGGTARAVSLRIGAIESVLHSWLIEWVRHMRAANPAFELELTVETTPVLVEQVKRGALDLAIAALPSAGEGLRTRALPPMEMVFVGHAELHRKRRYALADLAGGDLLTFQRGSQPHVALVDLFRRAGVDLGDGAARRRRLRRRHAAARGGRAAFGPAAAARAQVRRRARAAAGVRELPRRPQLVGRAGGGRRAVRVRRVI